MSHSRHLAVPLVDLHALHRPLRDQVLQRWAQVYDSGRFILGPEVERFETDVATELQVEHAIGVSNGTDALVCALGALGIGQGDTVLTTALSFVATATACLRSGAKLRLVDVDPIFFNLADAELARADKSDVRAIIGVHLFGQPLDVQALGQAAPGIDIIEDAAQAFGARAERNVGSLGKLAAFSFFPAKPLGGLGDAGLVTTRDPKLAERVRALRTHGRTGDGNVTLLGGNYRLDELQAAVLNVKLPHDRAWRSQRAENARFYAEAFSEISEVVAPSERAGTEHAWSVYSLRVLERRDELRAHLSFAGIETAVYYPRPLHLEPVLGDLGYARGDFPVAELATEQLLALPVHAGLSAAQRAHVVASVAKFFGHAGLE